jgi:hypothetical protein
MDPRSVFVLLAALISVDCSRSAPRAVGVCTLLGCYDGIIVHLAAMPSGPFQIEARPTGAEGATAYVYKCDQALPCQQDVFFSNLIADHIFVTVLTAGHRRETEIFPISYTTSHPNGPHCEPACRRATVTAQIPE